MTEIKYNLSNVSQVILYERVSDWRVRGEKEDGWALVWVDFQKDKEHLAHKLAKQWCQQLQFATYEVYRITETYHMVFVKTIHVQTDEVIEEHTITCDETKSMPPF